MCTVLVLLRPGEPWPLLIGANRDERFDRAADAPARWWPRTPQIVAGRDRAGGGSWFGFNDDGVMATIVNGMHRLGPLEGKRSRGEIVLRTLGEGDAEAAAHAAASLPAQRYRGFTLLIADREHAFAVTNDERTIRMQPLEPGHHMITPAGCDVVTSPRYIEHFPAFRDAAAPYPPTNAWSGWIALLRAVDEDDARRAVTSDEAAGVGTVSSALLAVPASPGAPAELLFADGPPARTRYERLSPPWTPGT